MRAALALKDEAMILFVACESQASVVLFTQVLQFKIELKNISMNIEKQPLTCYISMSCRNLKF